MRQIVDGFYLDYYTQLFNEKGLTKFSFSLTHKLVEKKYIKSISKGVESGINNQTIDILEIGAGKGEHLPYVRDNFTKYVMLDLLDPPNNFFWERDQRVSWIVNDICKFEMFGNKFDRIVVMCVLHHIDDLEAAFVNIKKLLKPGGTLSVFLSSDPGLMNRLYRRLIVTPRAKRLGFKDYELVNAIEHRNHYYSIKIQMNHMFAGYKIRRAYYPFRLPFQDLSLFSIWTITAPQEK